LKNLIDRVGGGILPLGGRGTEFGGHKGFGLALMVDILAGVLSGSAYGPEVHNLKPRDDGERPSPRVGHFFLALDISKFMPLTQFTERMDELIDRLKSATKAEGEDAIFIHGEKEFAHSEEARKNGILMADNVYQSLEKIAEECGIAPPACVAGT